MSDFFAGVHGARFPDVVMNKGPLPGTGGLPAPLHDSVDGRINYNSSLLGDIEPYAYGEPGYLSSQNSYLNIPHKIQKIVPFLYLPNPDGTDSFRLNHPIDDGDIAFTLRLDRNSEVCGGLSNKSVQRSGLGTAIDPMINLCTLNYILAGIQLCSPVPNLRDKWDRLLYYLDSSKFRGNSTGAPYSFSDIKRVVRHLIRPFGIAHGSEKQGGQHEGSLAAVTWPVSFVISLTLDGKDANLVNIWHKHDVEAGNDLVLRLKPVPIPPGGKYTLNHWGKGLVEKVFTPNTLRALEDVVGARPTHIWQLVPDIFSLDYELSTAEEASSMRAAMDGLVQQFRPPAPDGFAWQEEGYWHVARAQVHSRKYGLEEFYYNDMANNLRTGHMDVTFQPTFCAIPNRDFANQNGAGVVEDLPAQRNVFHLIGASPDEEGPKRSWQSSLRLERDFEGRPDPKRPRGGGVAGLGGSGAGMVSTGNSGFMVSTGNAGAGMVSTGNAGAGMVSTGNAGAGMVSTGNAGGMVSTGNAGGMVSTGNAGAGMVRTGNAGAGMVRAGPVMDDAVHRPSSLRAGPSSTWADGAQPQRHVSFLNPVLEEDIGEFEEAPPVSARQEPQETDLGAVSHLFSVAKPGLGGKAAKRPAKNRSIMGSILSADGSVTREQSRML